ncbi:MAG: hypothetical protein ABL911_00945 [Gallionella sp.]|nr:hypothetical protein [Gallionella sp.]
MDYTLSTLSIETITNLYLYGQPTKPTDLTSATLIRQPEVAQDDPALTTASVGWATRCPRGY